MYAAISSNRLTVEAVSTAQPDVYPFIPAFHRGEGCWLLDSEERRYFDATAGSGAVCLGHNHKRVIAAAIKQIQRLVHTGSMLHSDVRDELVWKLGSFSPFDSCAVLLAVTGTSAIEAAMKVVRAYTGRRSIVAFKYAYHGKSTGALAVSWRERYKQFSPLPTDATWVCPYPVLHSHATGDQPEACLNELQRTMDQARRVNDPPAAVLLEPLACTEGMLPAGRDFLEGVLRIAREAGSLVIYDEIYTGFGRSGTSFYSDRAGLTPDILVVGKGLGNGFPIAAVLGDPSVINALPSGVHTTTFAGHPVCCAAACEVIDVFQETVPWRRVSEIGAQILEFLQKLEANYWFVSAPRGEGLMLAFDCVDPDGRPWPQLAETFVNMALYNNLVLHSGGFQDCSIKLTPPLTIDTQEVQFLFENLEEIANDLSLEFQ